MATHTASRPSMQIVAGRYQIIRKIGRGGMGTVYLARQLGVGNQVALKFLPTHLSGDAQLRKRFEREAALSLEVTHPGAAQLLDSGMDTDGRLYIAFEYVEGDDLCTLLDREGALSYQDAIEVTCKVAEALAYAHGRGVIHRDIKPENIRVRRDLAGIHVKVLDFGIARIMDSVGTQLTMEGHVAGTPRYMAPEQIEGHPVDGRADIYTLGLVLFETLTGREAFTREQTSQLLWAQLHDPVPPLRDVQALRDFPELDLLIAKACAKVPAERFASMQEMVQALRQLPAPAWGPAAPVTRRSRSAASESTTDTEQLTTSTLGQPVRAGRTLWQTQARSWLALGVGTFGAVLAGWMLWSKPAPPAPQAPTSPPAQATVNTAGTVSAATTERPSVVTLAAPPSATPATKAPADSKSTAAPEPIITNNDESIERCLRSNKYSPDECLDAIKAYGKQHPETQFELGKRVRLNFMHWAAMPLFDAALALKTDSARCADADLSLAVISGLSLPEGRAEKAMAQRVLAGPCFAALRAPIEKELADSNANSYFGRSVCPIALKKGLAPAACEPPRAVEPIAAPPAPALPTTIDLKNARYDNIKVFRGPEGERLTMGAVQGTTDVYVLRFDGIRGEWNGKSQVHQLEPGSRQSTKLWTLHGGRPWYTLVSMGTKRLAYAPGAMDGLAFSYSEEDSKTATAEQLR